MSGDVRTVLDELADEAREELQRAVEYHDAVDVLRQLAWSVDRRVLADLDMVERGLAPVDAARWRVALAVAAATHVEFDEDDDGDVVDEAEIPTEGAT